MREMILVKDEGRVHSDVSKGYITSSVILVESFFPMSFSFNQFLNQDKE